MAEMVEKGYSKSSKNWLKLVRRGKYVFKWQILVTEANIDAKLQK